MVYDNFGIQEAFPSGGLGAVGDHSACMDAKYTVVVGRWELVYEDGLSGLTRDGKEDTVGTQEAHISIG